MAIVIVSFNRRDALRQTLRHCAALDDVARTIVVDNASADDSAAMVRDEFPSARLLALSANGGIAAFNQGVREAQDADLVLILDDDARPDPPSLARARDALSADDRVLGVALLPIHPATQRPEWRVREKHARFPMMGCANLVRRDAWLAVGGYCEPYFLYRNDTDLALCLLALSPEGASVDHDRADCADAHGSRVLFDPAWFAHHDSPAATHKSERWLRTATRNWIWMAKRHGRGLTRIAGIGLGVAWAARLGGMSTRRLACVASGAIDGVFTAAPPCAPRVRPDGRPYRALIRLLLQRRS
jgi:glycosyltransferase involved in cell wall biosynthesis